MSEIGGGVMEHGRERRRSYCSEEGSGGDEDCVVDGGCGLEG